MNKLVPLLALALLTQCAGCKTNDPAPKPPATQLDLLPPETQTGQRTFGCLVNGQAWTPAGSPLSGPLFSSQYGVKHLSLVANRNAISGGLTTRETIQIDIDDVNTVGVFQLTRRDISFANYQNLNTSCEYFTDATHPATVEVTRLDLVNRIVSGRFAFTLETPGCGKLVVTDGRFDSRF